MDYNQFAESIKQKYPQYQNVDNLTLSKKMVEKYPQYASKVTFEQPKKTSLGQKILNTGTDVANFFGAKGISEQFGADIARSQAQTPQEKNMVDYPSMREVVGSAIQTGANLIPGAGEGAGLLGKASVGAGTGLAFDVGSKLQNEDKTIGQALTPGIGTGIGAISPVIGIALQKAYNLTGNVLKNTAGVLSGKGAKVIDRVLEDPESALIGLKNAPEQTLMDNASKIRNRVVTISKNADTQFAKDLSELPKRLGRSPSVLQEGGTTTIKVDGKTYSLSTKGVKDAFTKSLKEFGSNVDTRNKILDFSEAPLDKAEQGRLQEIYDSIYTWKDTSPEGIYKLSRKISNFRKPGESSPELNAIIDSIVRNTRGYLSKRIPAVEPMLQKYTAARDIIDAFDQEFSTSGKFMGGTSEKIKTANKVGNLLSGQKVGAENLLKTQSGLKNIPNIEAGRVLAEGQSRTSASLGDFIMNTVNTVITPKQIGTIAAKLKIKETQVKPLIKEIKKLKPSVLKFLLNAAQER